MAERKRRKARLRKRLQLWRHTPPSNDDSGGPIVNEQTGLCLTAEGLSSSEDLRAVECNEEDRYQRWTFQKYTGLKSKLL